MFGRGNEICEVKHSLIKQELFSVCGKLVGYYPVFGWLWTECCFIKRQIGTDQWGDATDQGVLRIIQEVIAEVNLVDHVKEEWHIKRSQEGVIWSDASSLALGALLEIGGATAEDVAWLREKDDSAHINVAELDVLVEPCSSRVANS